MLITISCEKKEIPQNLIDPINPPPTKTFTAKDYSPLKPGNYWIYQLQVIDSNNVVTAGITDSAYVYDSITVRGRKFYQISGNTAVQGYFADSANCIIYSDGNIALKLSFTNDTISKTYYSQGGGWYNLFGVMKLNPTTFSFNAQTFTNCINRNDYFYSNFNPLCPNRIIYKTYSPGVGVVYANFCFVNSCDHWEIKLLRYKVN